MVDTSPHGGKNDLDSPHFNPKYDPDKDGRIERDNVEEIGARINPQYDPDSDGVIESEYVESESDGTFETLNGTTIVSPGDNYQDKLNTGGHVHFTDGEFDVQQVLDVPDYTYVTGEEDATIIHPHENGTTFRITGSETATVSLSSTVSEGDTIIPVNDSSQFTAGGYVLINSDAYTDGQAQPYGEIQKVMSVDTGANTITIAPGGVHHGYATANNARAIALDMANNVRLENFRIKGPVTDYLFHAKFHYARDCTVTNVTFEDTGGVCIAFESVVNTEADRCTFTNIGNGNAVNSYGAYVGNAARNVEVRNSTFKRFGLGGNVTHQTTVGGNGTEGRPREIRFIGNTYIYNDSYSSADAHCGVDIAWIGNKFSNINKGIHTGADTSFVRNNEFSTVNIALNHRANPKEIYIRNNTFKGVRQNALEFGSMHPDFDRLVVQNSTFKDIGYSALYGQWEGDVEQIDVSNCTFENVNDLCFNMEPVDATNDRIEEVNIHNNRANAIGDNIWLNATSTDWVRNLVVTDNHFWDITDEAFFDQGSMNHHVANNRVHGCETNAFMLYPGSGSRGGYFADNTIYDIPNGYGLFTGAYPNFYAVDNYIQGTSDSLYLEGSGAVVKDNIYGSGGITNNGTNAVTTGNIQR